ncbi:putative actin 2 [Trypanosoma cruzi]|uniref:Actin 2, putative n=2 Tax=Trypanosoma cruzi TaxID=5693 RepID=Q4CV94_TRYCC|nr:actin 2, putative [Trypanosoma cruzi]EAN84193.1 actin 2, putative [Trypanosoma cruzi]KAF8301607.1 putative actin 2 [Trypanosoma cruzi]PWV05989.1 putative actin 2 [Trypanosoma cruzi]RNC55941.1 putative actin 2 [Trypanosoma cruzi]|eukprot:XP_806044.1 actin 2 [Trypanosoma cruzi strain CL Brener]
MEATLWDEEPAVVLDNGSGNIKCGFAGEEIPRCVFPSVTGVSMNTRSSGSSSSQRVYVGDEALQEKGLRYFYPMEHGIVSDWDQMERVWRHAYEQLRVPPERQAVLLTEAPLNPISNREKMAETLFESFGVPALHVQIQAVLTLYSSGRTDGLVLDSGDGVTHLVPVFEGQTMPQSVRRLELAGRDLTEWMMELLSDELDRPFTTSADREVARRVKESLCYIPLFFEEELQAAEEDGINEDAKGKEPFTLPDGEVIHVGRARFCCPEILFNPALAEKPYDGIQHAVINCVNSCPIDLRRQLLGSIVLSGGNTMFKGMQQRLQSELAALANKRAAEDVRVVAASERKFSVWIGAAILASLTSFASEWITRTEYAEQGAAVLHKRCDSLSFVSK